MVIFGVTVAADGLAEFECLEFERTGTKDVFLVPMRVPSENVRLVNERVRVCERRQKRRCRKFQFEHDGSGIGCGDRIDHRVNAGPRTEDAGCGIDDGVPARGDVRGGELGAVMPFDAIADFERPGFPLVGRFRHLGAQVAHEIVGRCGVLRIDANQHAVEWSDRVHRCEGDFTVSVETRRCVGGDHICEDTATLWRLRRDSGEGEGHQKRGQQAAHRRLSFRVYLSSQIVAKSWFT